MHRDFKGKGYIAGFGPATIIPPLVCMRVKFYQFAYVQNYLPSLYSNHVKFRVTEDHLQVHSAVTNVSTAMTVMWTTAAPSLITEQFGEGSSVNSTRSLYTLNDMCGKFVRTDAALALSYKKIGDHTLALDVVENSKETTLLSRVGKTNADMKDTLTEGKEQRAAENALPLEDLHEELDFCKDDFLETL